MPSPIPGPIPLATATRQGQVSTTTQVLGGLKLFTNDVAGQYDIRTWGAVNGGTLLANDAAAAMNSAWAADSNAQLQVPTGVFYCGEPILMSAGNQGISGAGPRESTLQISPFTPDGTHIPAFAGPVVLVGSALTYQAGYSAPLITGATKSLVMWSNITHQYEATQLFLGAAASWSNMTGMTAFCGQGWMTVASIPNTTALFVSSSGALSPSYASSAFRIAVSDVGSGPFLYGTFTTTTAVYNWSSAANTIAYNTTMHVEVDYDGSFIDVYVDGTNVVHMAATGTLVQQPWEGITIGEDIQFGPLGGGLLVEAMDGEICGWRFSTVARHTGTGSFVPPVAAYAWDASTFALWNFDQDAVPGTLPPAPWVILQVLCASATPMKHYAHVPNDGYYINGPISITDILLDANFSGIGFSATGSPFSYLNNVNTNRTNKVGLGIYGGENFSWSIGTVQSISCTNGVGIDFWANAGNVAMAIDQYSAIGLSLSGGKYGSVIVQQSNNCITPLVTRSGGGGGELTDISNFASDFEIEVPNAIAAIVLTPFNDVIFRSSTINAFAYTGSAIPNVMCDGSPFFSVFENCTFDSIPGLANAQIFQQTANNQFLGPILLRNSINISPAVPWSLTADFVFQDNTNQRGGLQSISSTDTVGNNLAGTIFVLHGFPTSSYAFPISEPDGNYQLQFQCIGYSGSTPAAGSTEIISYTTSADGFTFTAGTDPGGTSQVQFAWTLIRTVGQPLLFEYLPSIGGSYSNPLATASPTGDFAVGITIIPYVANALGYDATQATGSIVSMGTTPLTAPWWELYLVDGGGQGSISGMAAIGSGVDAFTVDSFVTNGKLAGVLNPGTHNLVLSYEAGLSQVYVDGIPVFASYGLAGFPGYSAGTQQATIYTGARSDASDSLTGIATLRNLKVALNAAQVLTQEPDTGPQSMAQAAFFGDEFTIGYSCATTTFGFATQIANLQYGTTYWWIAASGGNGRYAMSNLAAFGPGIVQKFWSGWGGNQAALTGIVICAGFNDCLSGAAGYNMAAEIWPVLETVFNGGPAIGIWTPPTINAYAWAGFVPPTSGTATCVINGVSFACPFNTDAPTTLNALEILINASGPTLALITPVVTQNPPGNWFLRCTAVAPGTSGNGVTCTTDGGGGARWYTGPASTGATYGGNDNFVIIDGIQLIANFDTNAATTVNDLIALIAANGTLNAIVTGTEVSNQLVLTANSNGIAGNSITLGGNESTDPYSSELGGGGWTGIPISENGTMTGGYNGSIQNAIPCVVCTVPPFGQAAGYTMAKDTQRAALNTDIKNFVTANPTYMTLADLDLALQKSGSPTLINPIYLAADDTFLTDAGHLECYTIIAPLLPQGAGAPTGLTYATNPASYAHGSPIASNNPSVTGSITRYTVSPPLPTGLSISSSTGDVTGTPTTGTAMATYVVVAANATGATTCNLVITIT